MTLEQNVRETNSVLVAIKDKIVECGVEVAEGTHAREYAPKIGQVYEEGKKSEYDAFWDVYQENGKKKYYVGAFAGPSWNNETFKPKYNMTNIYAASYMFFDCGIKEDLTQILDNLGLTMSLSDNCPNVVQMFGYSDFTRIPELNLVSCTTSSVFISAANLETIDKIKVSETTVYTTWFNNCTALKNVIFEGVIAQNGLNFQWSTQLSKASITSIINALSTTTSGLSVTLSKTAVETAFGSTESAEWTSLIAKKSNWTISLVQGAN